MSAERNLPLVNLLLGNWFFSHFSCSVVIALRLNDSRFGSAAPTIVRQLICNSLHDEIRHVPRPLAPRTIIAIPYCFLDVPEHIFTDANRHSL
jgi:hypothetical protein